MGTAFGRWQVRLVTPIVAALLLGGGTLAVVAATATPAGAATFGPVDPSIPDGNTNSLRDVLENKAANGDTVVLQAGATYQLTHCTDADIDINASVTINGNGATIKGTCTTNEGGVLDTGHPLTINSVTLTGGHALGDNGGAITDFGGALVINNSAIVGNFSACDVTATTTTITNSTIANNVSGGVGGGVVTDQATDLLTVTNSTISNNTAHQVGGIDASGTAKLIYTTLVDNTTGGTGSVCGDAVGAQGEDASQPKSTTHLPTIRPQQANDAANLELENTDGTPPLDAFGTVIALPHGGANCGANGGSLTGTSSSGYNYSDDSSCDLVTSTDKQNGGDPLLGALGANGGIGPTRVPQTGSPLLNAIPIPTCGGGNTLAGFTVTTDERGITRPQETGCEIGAVEVPAPAPVIIIAPKFTG